MLNKKKFLIFILLLFISCSQTKNDNVVSKDFTLEYSLIEAVKTDNVEKVNEILKTTVDIDTKELLKEGKINASPLVIASARGNLELVKSLVENGANLNTGGELLPIQMAVYNKRKEIIDYFLDNKVDLECLDRDKNNVLMTALLVKDERTAKILIDKNINLNNKNTKGVTPLMLALEIGNINNIKLLIENGADKEMKDNEGNTPIFYAINTGNIEAAEILIGKGININISNNNGETPLIIASDNNNVEMVKLLLKNGANKDLKDNEGSKAIDYTDNEEIKKLLK